MLVLVLVLERLRVLEASPARALGAQPREAHELGRGGAPHRLRRRGAQLRVHWDLQQLLTIENNIDTL